MFCCHIHFLDIAGGVTVSFFEWVQNLQNFRWEEEEVNKRLDRAMTEAFAQIWEISRQKKLPLRTAAFVKALQSVTRAHLHSAFFWLVRHRWQQGHINARFVFVEAEYTCKL
jgi:glutamate dehydrogenase/leucine dehydrogenase